MPIEGLEIPDFTSAEKSSLYSMKNQSSIHSTKFIIDNFNLNHQQAKYIVTHINHYGKCNSCTFDKLDEEYIKCPKCGALNFNWPTNEIGG
ncbi:hypothetical protein [Pedobacter xixiisoli]|uniref:hypothetical protein n=1 Tax=Pedobacter xixiisoli TaxID=1476464 RepID=UPI00110CBE62|nr:hypothetical protein [Pedobacter xixiisoli]